MNIEMVIAVALGLTPVAGEEAQKVDYDPAAVAQVGQFTTVVDAKGTTRITGIDRQGRHYSLVIDRNGWVDATLPGDDREFRVTHGI